MRARVGGRRASPAPSGMTEARAGGAFAFVGAPMPVEAARLAPCPAIANADIAGWPSRAYRLCGGGPAIYVAAASWLTPCVRIGVEHGKAPSGARGRRRAARHDDAPPLPRLWRLLHKDGRQGFIGNDCASWGNADDSAESARAP